MALPRKAKLRKRHRSPRTGSLYLRGSIWWIQYTRKGKKKNESTGFADKQQAEKFLQTKLGEIASGKCQEPPDRVTINNLVDLVIEDYRFRKLRSAGITEKRATKHVRPLAGVKLAQEFNYRAYVERRREEKAEDSTINRELSIIHRGFVLGHRHKPNPLVLAVPYFEKLAEENVRQGFLEHDQYLRLRTALPAHLKCMLVVGYHVGSRVDELRQLRWEQVDLKARQIHLRGEDTKNKRPRTLPIYGDMEPWLQMAFDEHQQKYPDCPWVFHYLNRQIGSHLKGWSKAATAASVPGLLFHDLRRSAVRNMERAGIPRKVAMSITGHTTEAVYRRYDIVNPRDLELAGQKMAAYLEGQESQAGPVTTPVATVAKGLQ